MYVMQVGTAETILKVRGHRSKVKVMNKPNCGGMHFDGGASKLILLCASVLINFYRAACNAAAVL